MTFPVDMDTTSLPPRAKFKINVDTVDKSVATLEWLNDRVLGASFSEAALGPTTVRFEYTTQTGKLRTALGADVEPFDLLGTEFTITIFASYADPDLDIFLQFNLDMNQLVQPVGTDFVMTIDGIPKSVDSISWLSATFLKITHTEAGLTPLIARLEFPSPVPNLRTVSLSQTCPFDLTEPIT